jgi:serine proteinase inhibitor
MTKRLLYFPILLLLVSCIQSNKTPQTLAKAAEKAEPDYQLTEEETKFVSASNTFSLKLFQLLSSKKSKESVALSPMAVIYSLNMLNNGANGRTQEIISKSLGYSAKDLESINSLNRKMLIGQRMEKTNEHNESQGYMITANFLTLHEQTKILPDFQEALEHYYFTNIIDSANTPNGKEKANKLCKTITKGHIQTLPIKFTSLSAAQLINAVTLKATWTSPFDKNETKPMPFYTEDGKTKQIDMMQNYDTKQVYQGYMGKDYQVLHMPLENGFSVYAVLPLKKNNLQDIIRTLTIKDLQKISQSTKVYDYVNILFPRFTTSLNIPMKQLYGEMGLGSLFSSEADFSKMSSQSLVIDDVFQQISLNINENGVSAKAVQVTQIEALSGTVQPTRFTFKADHPFLYYILDRYNNICFMGQYMGN